MNIEGNKPWEPGPERFMTRQEVGILLAKAEELMHRGRAKRRKPLVRDAMIIYSAMYSGLRRFEICALRIQDLFLANGRSHLIVRHGKNGKGRTVHVGKEFKHLLKDYLVWKSEQGELSPESYLIRNARGERYTPTGLWKRWRKYAPNGHRLHDARHTNASLLYQATRDLRMVQQQLGHSRITTTTVYATVCPELIQDGMDKMERLAKSSLKPSPMVRPSTTPDATPDLSLDLSTVA